MFVVGGSVLRLQIEHCELNLGELLLELRELHFKVGEQIVLGLEELLEGGTVGFGGWLVWEPEFRVHGVRDLVPEINSSDFCLLDLGLLRGDLLVDWVVVWWVHGGCSGLVVD